MGAVHHAAELSCVDEVHLPALVAERAIVRHHLRAMRVRLMPLDRSAATNEVVGQPLYKATMSVRRDRPDRPEKIADGEHHQEAKADKRGSLQAAGGEIRIARPYHLVKAPSLVVKLCADSADKKIPMRRHHPENDSRAILDLPISLGQRRQYNVSFGHRRRSSVSYTGSSVA